MAYFGLVTKLQNVRKDENSDRLYLADCFNEGVIIGSDMQTGQEVLYLPTDGEIAGTAGIDLLKTNRGALMKSISMELKGKADMKIVSAVVGGLLK